jgi:tRNA A37 N6-isopentenylltransferase MiaA
MVGTKGSSKRARLSYLQYFSIAILRSIDPTTADAIPQNDFYRLGRALEIYELSGKPPSFFRMQSLPLDGKLSTNRAIELMVAM